MLRLVNGVIMFPTESHMLREKPRDRDAADSRKQEPTDEVDLIMTEDTTSVLKPMQSKSSPVRDGRTSLSPPVTPTSRSTPSPTSTSRVESTTSSPSEDPLDNLIKSIAKETGALHSADVHSQPSSLEVDVNVIPNNQSKYVSLPRPIPPDKLKCNILKAKVEEDLKKSTILDSNGNQPLLNGFVSSSYILT